MAFPRRDTRGAASLRLVALDAANPCCPTSDAALRENPRPQRRGLCPLRGKRWGCHNHVTLRYPPRSERVTPLRRHLLDPQRRKSSIIPGPLVEADCSSTWSTFTTTASKPPWRSMVSRSVSVTAYRRTTISAAHPLRLKATNRDYAAYTCLAEDIPNGRQSAVGPQKGGRQGPAHELRQIGRERPILLTMAWELPSSNLA